MAVEFKDYYKILGVARGADAKAIKSAYRRLARKYHPDVAKGKDAPDRFKEITEAYEVLSDPEKRGRYDSLGPDWQRYVGQAPGPGPGGGFRVEHAQDLGDLGDLGGFSDFFRSIFGEPTARGGARGHRTARPGAEGTGFFGHGGARDHGDDLQTGLSITLEDAFGGALKSLSIDGRQVDVKIPAGVRSGQRVRVSGEGTQGSRGRGDLYLTITVLPHPFFERKGDDVHLALPVSVPEAALGATVEVPTLRGKVSMKIPPGTSSGRVFRLPGYGMPRVKEGGAGDQMVTVRIVVPPDPTPAERDLFEQLRALRRDHPRAHFG